MLVSHLNLGHRPHVLLGLAEDVLCVHWLVADLDPLLVLPVVHDELVDLPIVLPDVSQSLQLALSSSQFIDVLQNVGAILLHTRAPVQEVTRWSLFAAPSAPSSALCCLRRRFLLGPPRAFLWPFCSFRVQRIILRV